MRINSLLQMDRFVGSYELKQGLLKFGVGVSDELANMLLQELGGSTHFTAQDLASFAQHARQHSSERLVKSYQGGNPMPSGLFPSRDKTSDGVQKNERIAPSQCSDDEMSRILRPVVATPQQQDGEQVTYSDRAVERAVLSEEVGSRSRSQFALRKFRWDELPSWARKSSKRALQELMGHHQR